MAISQYDVPEVAGKSTNKCLICCCLCGLFLILIGSLAAIAFILISTEQEGFVPVEGDLAPITIITADRDNVQHKLTYYTSNNWLYLDVWVGFKNKSELGGKTLYDLAEAPE